jgi:hypothetical protein
VPLGSDSGWSSESECLKLSSEIETGRLSAGDSGFIDKSAGWECKSRALVGSLGGGEGLCPSGWCGEAGRDTGKGKLDGEDSPKETYDCERESPEYSCALAEGS